uniref:ATP synthase subunit a n=1 Tax=Megaustenia imperator imperator TaxID=2979634 RepID=A0A977K793_9EUPU|nr:ATP synthase F0 subunit 6 [Megaustenia imperator imperator]
MFTDLFSSLDGMHSFWSWGISLILILLVNNSTWVNSILVFINNIMFSFWKGKNKFNPLKLFLSSLMFFIILNNLIGLTPYTYGVTSSLWFNSSLALILWLSLLISGWIYAPKMSAAHLAPAGAPAALMPFLIIIETISILIRPLTLTVRLVANISAGHIVLSLIANVLSSKLMLLPYLLLFLMSMGYVLFELFVCFIQAYIFTLLISLYANEHP